MLVGLKERQMLRALAPSGGGDQRAAGAGRARAAVDCVQRSETPSPNWEQAEREVRGTLGIAWGCPVHNVMKDTHTFRDEPERITRWTDMAPRCVRGGVDVGIMYVRRPRREGN